MSIITLPESVRQSALALALDEKIAQPQQNNFDYWGKFSDLREKVSAQVGEMKILFPEFTPHDEPQHLARLFGIADKLLGPERYSRMNVAELFLLACGLYAHDWGMAVSRRELEYLRAFACGTVDTEVFTPLDDEPERLRQFVTKEGLTPLNSTINPTLTDDHLRSYIRETHAWRSGVRVRAFFESAGFGIPQVLERVCQGHWLDFSQLDDEQRFSVHQGVLGYTVNLRAIAIYVRLVDLFDISDDRTPYAVWRFVAPADARSSMEWRKHRALSPVTFPVYGDGRCVRFDGATTDPEVWAELEDLRQYCEQQIDGSMELLARHHDVKHTLDLRKLDWKVTAERFRPVNIRFEFHRQRMFEILASEIYQDDSHVFLRELLQNSIDAVRLRKALVERRNTRSGTRRDVGLGFDDAIYFEVDHGMNGDSTIRCRDSGVGMDDYIVRNYLAIAGVSYYQSEDFRRAGLQMDPISRFGIGILSCFMVADRIEIETCREPRAGEAKQVLRIDVPAVDKQFRVFDGAADAEIGTTVTVHVLGKKLKSDVLPKQLTRDPATLHRLQVADYLSAIAGFVECPIVVDEDGQRTVIVHPDCLELHARTFKLDDRPVKINTLAQEYPWESAFVPQDTHAAKEGLFEVTFDLKKDLGLSDYNGTVKYICPRVPDAEISQRSMRDEGLEITSSAGTIVVRTVGNFWNMWTNREGLSRSCQCDPTFAIYRDGLLVADVPPPKRDNRIRLFSSMISWPAPALRINLPKKLAGIPDVARRSLLGANTAWDASIWRAVVDYLARKDGWTALQKPPLPRMEAFANLSLFYHLTGDEVAELVPLESWPLPVLIPEEGAVIRDGHLSLGSRLLEVPEEIQHQIISALGWSYSYNDAESNQEYLRKLWRGERSIVFSRGSQIARGSAVAQWMEISNFHIPRLLRPVEKRFVTPAFPGLPPLAQIEYEHIELKTLSEVELVEHASNDPVGMDGFEKCALQCMWWRGESDVIMKAVPFGAPFQKYFYCSGHGLNSLHPMTIILMKLGAAIRWQQLKNPRRSSETGHAEDQFLEVARSLHNPAALRDRLSSLIKVLRNAGIIDLKDSVPEIGIEDYVPQSKTGRFIERLISPRDEKEKQRFDSLAQSCIREFGHRILNPEPEEAPGEVVKFMQKWDKN